MKSKSRDINAKTMPERAEYAKVRRGKGKVILPYNVAWMKHGGIRGI